jgi:hypothetical protein
VGTDEWKTKTVEAARVVGQVHLQLYTLNPPVLNLNVEP